jgi:hypothetical protein
MPPAVDELAREAARAFSPVGRIIVETRNGQAGFKLCYEQAYWGGYRPLSKEELLERSPQGFTLHLAHQTTLYIEPVPNLPNFDPDFFHVRLESGFRTHCRLTDAPAPSDSLSINEVQGRVRELENHMDNGKPSYAKLRQYFVAQQIERDLDLRETRITNVRLKTFLEERIGSTIKSGYQISSFLGDVERVFPNKLRVEKTRYGVSLSWKLAP